MKKILFLILFILASSPAFSQDNRSYYAGDTLAVVDANGDTLMVFYNSGNAVKVFAYVQRREVAHWDVIAWFPPADSGAVLDTLDNRKEVLQFYNNTDSVYAFNTWLAPPNFNAIDSVEVIVEAVDTDGDSASYVLKGVGIAVGESGSTAFAVTARDTVDLGTSARVRKRFLFTGITGISANDEVFFELSRDNTISQNAADPIPVVYSRIFWR
jgi:hypothetical protein